MKKIIYIALLFIAFTACEKEGDPKSSLTGTTWEYVATSGEISYTKELKFRSNTEGSYYDEWMRTDGIGSSSSQFFEYEVSGSSIYIKLETPAESLSGTFSGDKMNLTDHYGSYTFQKK